jgi:hypothetical protein
MTTEEEEEEEEDGDSGQFSTTMSLDVMTVTTKALPGSEEAQHDALVLTTCSC